VTAGCIVVVVERSSPSLPTPSVPPSREGPSSFLHLKMVGFAPPDGWNLPSFCSQLFLASYPFWHAQVLTDYYTDLALGPGRLHFPRSPPPKLPNSSQAVAPGQNARRFPKWASPPHRAGKGNPFLSVTSPSSTSRSFFPVIVAVFFPLRPSACLGHNRGVTFWAPLLVVIFFFFWGKRISVSSPFIHGLFPTWKRNVTAYFCPPLGLCFVHRGLLRGLLFSRRSFGPRE